MHVKLSLSYSKALNWLTKDDHFYLAFDHSTTINDNKMTYNDLYTYQNGNDPVTQSSKTSDEFQDNKYNSFLSIRSGYILRHSIDDLFLLSGLNFSYTKIKAEYLSTAYRYGMNHLQTVTAIFTVPSITLPIYARYEINEFIGIFGGINYGYFYHQFDTTYEPKDLVIQNSNSTVNVKYGADKTTTRFLQSQEEYVGCVVKHSSGFEIQTLVNSDLANLKSWQMSVIYTF